MNYANVVRKTIRYLTKSSTRCSQRKKRITTSTLQSFLSSSPTIIDHKFLVQNGSKHNSIIPQKIFKQFRTKSFMICILIFVTDRNHSIQNTHLRSDTEESQLVIQKGLLTRIKSGMNYSYGSLRLSKRKKFSSVFAVRNLIMMKSITIRKETNTADKNQNFKTDYSTTNNNR